MRRAFLLLLLIALPAGLQAAPERYSLTADTSRVSFTTAMGNQAVHGRFPIRHADIVLDVSDLSRCRISVTLGIAGASADFPMAADALKSASVLDARHFPEAVFTSTGVSGTAAAAQVTGLLTLRGIARPLTLQAEVMRQQGHAAGDLSHMTVHLTGQISRADFGANGWADMVGDVVTLDILARITRTGP